MELKLSSANTKIEVFEETQQYLGKKALNYFSVDSERPWGGFFVIDDGQAQDFVDMYFPNYPKDQILKYGGKLSPKILVVEPSKRLSWQYHDRRAELWRVISGPIGVITSATNEQGELNVLQDNSIIQFEPKTRHRLVGLANWGIVAEIWQHTDMHNPSTEEDIIRLDDDFGR